MTRWRTGNSRRAKRKHSNALFVTVLHADGSVASHAYHPLPNAHMRAMLAADECKQQEKGATK